MDDDRRQGHNVLWRQDKIACVRGAVEGAAMVRRHERRATWATSPATIAGAATIPDPARALDVSPSDVVSPVTGGLEGAFAFRGTPMGALTDDRQAIFLVIAALRDDLLAGPDLAALTDAQRSLLVDLVDALRTMDRATPDEGPRRHDARAGDADGHAGDNHAPPTVGDGTAARAQPKQDKGRDPRGTTPSP